MKNKKVLVVIIIIIMVLTYFGYKYSKLIEYDALDTISEKQIETDKIFSDTLILDKIELYNNTITIEDLTIENYFEDYENSETDKDLMVKKDDNNNVISFYSIKSFERYVDILNIDSYIIHNEGEKINNETDEDLKSFLEKNNIKDDIDLLRYLKDNYPLKNNIFTCVKTMKRNYILNMILIQYPEFSRITLINGFVKGYIINMKNNDIKEIHLLDDNKQYIITLSGIDITNNEFITKLLSSVKFK